MVVHGILKREIICFWLQIHCLKCLLIHKKNIFNTFLTKNIRQGTIIIPVNIHWKLKSKNLNYIDIIFKKTNITNFLFEINFRVDQYVIETILIEFNFFLSNTSFRKINKLNKFKIIDKNEYVTKTVKNK